MDTTDTRSWCKLIAESMGKFSKLEKECQLAIFAALDQEARKDFVKHTNEFHRDVTELEKTYQSKYPDFKNEVSCSNDDAIQEDHEDQDDSKEAKLPLWKKISHFFLPADHEKPHEPTEEPTEKKQKIVSPN